MCGEDMVKAEVDKGIGGRFKRGDVRSGESLASGSADT
jgi:hypothetical protein